MTDDCWPSLRQGIRSAGPRSTDGKLAFRKKASMALFSRRMVRQPLVKPIIRGFQVLVVLGNKPYGLGFQPHGKVFRNKDNPGPPLPSSFAAVRRILLSLRRDRSSPEVSFFISVDDTEKGVRGQPHPEPKIPLALSLGLNKVANSRSGVFPTSPEARLRPIELFEHRHRDDHLIAREIYKWPQDHVQGRLYRGQRVLLSVFRFSP